MLAADTFLQFSSPLHRQYESLRAHYVEGKSAREAAEAFGYTLPTFYSLMHDVRTKLADGVSLAEVFFVQNKVGRRPKGEDQSDIDEMILALRKNYLSVPDIKAHLDAQGIEASETYIYNMLKHNGFARLPRRSRKERDETISSVKVEAPESGKLDFVAESFTTPNSLGLLCLLPYLQQFGIDKLIMQSQFPQTKPIPRLQSILSFVALKLSNVRRYTNDDTWCMDRGLGFFAGLNVLPKAAWFTSYSHRVTRTMNRTFLKSLHDLWTRKGLLSDTANLDFTTIPYWGDDAHLENNWSGTRHKALAGILAALVQDPDTGIITYGDTNVRHDNKDQVVLEFLDFCGKKADLRYLVFDSKFTTYENLAKLDAEGVRFITIRRRGKNIVNELDAIPAAQWKKLRVPDGTGKGRTVCIVDSTIVLRGYDKQIRQIALRGTGRIKPALIITNDFDLSVQEIVRKYARRWLVEKEISEQIEFFHINRISSSMVIKVDFDLTMTILAHNILRLLASDLQGYSHMSAPSLFQRFLHNSGKVSVDSSTATVSLRKKRHLPALLTAMEPFNNKVLEQWGGLHFCFQGDSRS